LGHLSATIISWRQSFRKWKSKWWLNWRNSACAISQDFLAALIRQPSSRVRSAVIALLLARPDFASHVPAALQQLKAPDAQRLRFFYTAAVYLQGRNADDLRLFLAEKWQQLPDLYSMELGISGDTPESRLKSLACLHAQATGEHLNWMGTYENAARHLLRRWEMERIWKP
jgi:hypothetical protein